MITYKINLRFVFLKFVFVSIVFYAIISFSLDKRDFGFLIVMILLIVGVEFFVFFCYKTLVKIEIKNDTIELYFRKYFFWKVKKIIKKPQFKYSYKNEIGARGVEALELRFYENDIKIVGIGRGLDGWKDEIVSQMIDEFKELKIEEIE